ncbi:MAG: hypothetical protein ACUVXI_16425 [bacterium]
MVGTHRLSGEIECRYNDNVRLEVGRTESYGGLVLTNRRLIFKSDLGQLDFPLGDPLTYFAFEKTLQVRYGDKIYSFHFASSSGPREWVRDIDSLRGGFPVVVRGEDRDFSIARIIIAALVFSWFPFIVLIFWRDVVGFAKWVVNRVQNLLEGLFKGPVERPTVVMDRRVSDGDILRLARANGGRLTVTQVAEAFDMSLSESERRLNDMVDDFRVAMVVEDSGIIFYEFREMNI